MKTLFLALALVTLVPQAPQDDLLALKDGVVDALNANDVERLLTYTADDVVVTWPNAEVTTGKEALRDYYARTVTRPGAIVQSFTTTAEVAETHLYGDDVAVVHGRSDDRILLSSGAQLDVDARWTATLVRENDRWRIASLHTSSNLLDNPILEKMKITGYILAGFGLVMGLTIGLGVWVFTRKRTARTSRSTQLSDREGGA